MGQTGMLRLFDLGGVWHRVRRCDARARALADRHYSRQTRGAREFMGNGRPLVLLTDDALAVWGALENRDRAGHRRWRVTIFRNEGPALSSTLVREATNRTFAFWHRRYGGLPQVPLRTEVDVSRTRRKRDPGRCFRRAGWTEVGRTKGKAAGAGELVILEAPGEAQRLPKTSEKG